MNHVRIFKELSYIDNTAKSFSILSAFVITAYDSCNNSRNGRTSYLDSIYQCMWMYAEIINFRRDLIGIESDDNIKNNRIWYTEFVHKVLILNYRVVASSNFRIKSFINLLPFILKAFVLFFAISTPHIYISHSFCKSLN